jgi:hypothetical protein
MCHDAWWRERRARRDEESREMWRDFDRVRRDEAPEDPAEKPGVTRLDADEQEPVPTER